MPSSPISKWVHQSWFSVLVLTYCYSIAAGADELKVKILSSDQQPAANIVVFAQSKNPNDTSLLVQPTSSDSTPQPLEEMQRLAVMDQLNSQFVPHILVVQQDTWVNFPNSDSIKHHVYSFSPAKPFQLKLYDGGTAQPLQFSQQGEVALGCNIHDWMLGYIFVVDSPWFAKTAKNGEVSIELPSGDYELKIWSPLLQGRDKDFSQDISVSGSTTHNLQLQSPLLPALSDYENSDELDDY
ncbi:methylamine utilization protein [Alteromonadaceae bacterium BrNp21-10]|nr:methylamine utilization protein [Alteromonadaceae bacterium BrNp21-10]